MKKAKITINVLKQYAYIKKIEKRDISAKMKREVINVIRRKVELKKYAKLYRRDKMCE